MQELGLTCMEASPTLPHSLNSECVSERTVAILYSVELRREMHPQCVVNPYPTSNAHGGAAAEGEGVTARVHRVHRASVSYTLDTMTNRSQC